MHRLFVAIRPPAPIRARLRALMGGVERARWQDDDQLHLTLRYIGEVERPLAEEIALALGHVRAAPFDLALAGVGAFERRGRVDTLWAGVSPHEAVSALHKRVDQTLIRLGLAPEGRAYLPHITLARFTGGGAVDAFAVQHAGLVTAPFPVTHFALFESTLGSEGARYETIERYALG